MKRMVLTSFSFALFVFSLAGCPGDNGVNRTNLNSNLQNINVVDVNRVSNVNAPNVNLPNVNTTESTNAASDARSFISTAAEDGMFEVQAGQAAASKARSADVKQFGQEMAADHTKAGNELKQLAQKESVTLPTDVSAAQKQKLEKLKALSGAEFDREYMNMMVEAHQKAVDLFQNQASMGNNTDVKAFASKTLPTLKDHLEKARSIKDNIK